MNIINITYKSLCRLTGALLFLGLLSGCAQNPVTGGQDFVMISENKELEMGRTYHPQIIEQYGRYEDEALQRYVQDVGQRLAAVSHRDDLVYRFTVLDSPVINAFALPGGYIYITRGMMAYLNSEAELAAVLGHEIGHVTARHGVRQQSAAQAASLGYTLGAILLPGLRTAGAQDLFNVFGGALLSGYGREHELESDRLGAEYLARSGYPSEAMIEVIGVLKDQATFAEAEAKKQGQDYQGYHGLFASHPDNDTRLQEVVKAADKYKTTVREDEGTERYLQRIDGMVFGDSESQGIRSGRNFYHSEMQFALSFPQNWHIQNNPSSLRATAPQGAAIIEMGASDLNRKQTPAEFIRDRLNIKDLKNGEPLSTNGLQGYTGLTVAEGKPVRVAVIYLREQAFIFIATTKSSGDFNKFDPAFRETVMSFHAMRQDEQQFAEAQRIDVVKVDSNDSYSSWAAKTRISNSPIQQLRLLNGDYPNGELKPGQLAKRVR
ncbi:M48 family metalloprotease [Methylophaga sp. UBA3613]|jgi:predicted Zn-dependent protease|uniref:M48 family metalloprotease n=2 Tax=Methylophaga TaxID=40222 RepID=UPI000C981427|nr:M48 family metalloprotease [Methylophaga sp. UBA3613]MAP27654.1 peptidase [Methylophaga sp.]HCO01668.1 peptidase [Methylophaga sp.]|tara:strand:- start:12597 stop:14072 length:1476 start_codon:yes stop_codon:yes gene_type:complete